MSDLLVTKKGLVDIASKKLNDDTQVVEHPNTLDNLLKNLEGKDRVIILVDLHPDIFKAIKNLIEKDVIVRLDSEPFSHPACHFSNFFIFSILYLLKKPELASFHSYATSIPVSIFHRENVQQLWQESNSLTAFNMGILALALFKNLKIKNINLSPPSPSPSSFEVLKNEFINVSATLMKILETSEVKEGFYMRPKFQLQKDARLRVPGSSFLKKEFTSGFRKYAPFWKRHLYEDHFALLSGIYSGREEYAIDDRIWVRIMFELLDASLGYEDKHKIARRIFPIYALYLNTINNSYLLEKLNRYIEILEEEVQYWEN